MVNRTKISEVPQVTELVKPTVQALLALGGSGNIQEINEKVYEITKLPNEILNIPHSTDGRTQIDYRLAWARTRLKLLGLLENSSRSVWTLTKPNINVEEFNFDENQQKLDKDRRKPKGNSALNARKESSLQQIEEQILDKANWKE